MSKVTNIERKEKELAPREPVRVPRMLTPFEEMDRLFERMWEGFGPRWLRPLRSEWPWGREPELGMEYQMPRVDVVDREAEVLVRAELPGVEKKDLDVSVTEQTLTLRASAHREEVEEKGEYRRNEIVRGEYVRTLALPAAVDGEKARATFKDGLLELTLPKLEIHKRQRIAVQ
jgi:HSP20 family protein